MNNTPLEEVRNRLKFLQQEMCKLQDCLDSASSQIWSLHNYVEELNYKETKKKT